MSDISDEMLMAYVDGQIDSAGRNAVELALASDSGLHERMKVFEVSGSELARLFNQPMIENTPSHLIHAIWDAPMQTVARAPVVGPNDTSAISDKWWTVSSLLGLWTLPRAVAFAGACGVAGIVGWIANDVLKPTVGGNDLVAMKDGRLFASGVLHKSLESEPSNKVVALTSGPPGGSVQVISTFRANTGGFCREYEVVASVKARHVGLGCRESSGSWMVQAYGPAGKAPTKPGGFQVAGAPSSQVVDAAIERVIEGAALASDQEKRLIARGWLGE